MHGSPRADSFPPRITLAALMFVGCCLLSSARLVIETPAFNHLPSDPVVPRSDHRFAALKAELPRSGVVGYIGEAGNLSVGDYYLTQYALAPLVVDRSANHRLVIGNFPATPPAVATQGLQLVKDYGSGVALFTNPAFANSAADDSAANDSAPNKDAR